MTLQDFAKILVFFVCLILTLAVILDIINVTKFNNRETNTTKTTRLICITFWTIFYALNLIW